jgi:histidyl-tRNA synthetase
MSVQRCKGMQDFSPEEMRRFRLIEGVFRDCALKWGYDEVRTPTLEYLHLFTSAGTLTPSRLGRVYSFLDWDGWSGERVVLRPDGTIPIARLYIEDLKQKLAKLFYVTNVFVFEETGKESREKWQCGVELIGAGSPAADVELVLLALEALGRMGLKDIEVRLSHANLIRAVLSRFDLNPEEQHRIFDRLLDGDETVFAMAKERSPELGSTLAALLNLKGKSSGFLKNLKAVLGQSSKDLKPALDDFIGSADLLQAMGVSYQIDLSSGRGFEYYTGLMFKLEIGGEQIGGGGRYDSLIPLMGGADVPASGFALYLDRLMKLVSPATETAPQAGRILIKTESAESLKEAFKLAAALHEAGRSAEVDFGGQTGSGFAWLVSVNSGKKPAFTLTGRAKRKKLEAATMADVLKLLGSVK